MDSKDSHNSNSTLIKDIYDFLRNGEKQIKYSPNKDIVMILGNTGSGKSTLTQFISGNAHTLLSHEVEEGTGDYVIVDKNNKISGNSTIVSQTIYPDLVEDTKTHTLYYDCPGFSDTRSAAHEIAATYFIKKVIDSAGAVKLVFVVSHHSVSRGADRQDFILMLQHATDLISQMEKFKNSLALVVTKIENRFVGNKIVSDQKVIRAIGNYLKQAKDDIEKRPVKVTSTGESSDTKALSLLNIFLSKGEDGNYTRIGILRKPNEPGLIRDIELMNDGKTSLENLINRSIKFIKPAITDFGYTVSAKSKVHNSGLTEEINKTIVKQLSDIGREVKNYCTVLEEKTSDLDDFSSISANLRDSFSKLLENAIKDTITPEMLITEIDNNIKNFKITIADHYLKTVKREEDYIKFLNLVSNGSIKNHKSSLLAAGLMNLTEYLSDSHSFYRFLYNMYQKLSEFDIQKNRNKYSTVHVNAINDLFESVIFKDIETILKENSRIKEMKLDTPKLRLLNKVLDQTLKYQIEVITHQTDKIIVKGFNVMLSDVSKILRNNDIKFIEVYALHKMFIDSSLDLTGREIQLTTVAPVWEVVGTQRIILNGKPGMDHSTQKAEKGTDYGESGSDGLPGIPGGPAGHFVGIGKRFINDEHLYISANGGHGGDGQDGGDGANGLDGSQCPDLCEYSALSDLLSYIITIKKVHSNCPATCTIENNSTQSFVISNTYEIEYIGGVGGNGGNGGINGYGGQKGTIYIKKVGTESQVLRIVQTALDGHPGRIGLGGARGNGGRSFCYKGTTYVFVWSDSTFGPIDKWAKGGKQGNDGSNLWGRSNALKLPKLINLNNAITEYKNYLLSNINNNLQERFLTKFFNEIDNNKTSLKQPTNRKRRSIMKLTGIEKSEEQLRKKYEIQSQNYNQYIDNRKENYYLDRNYHLNDSKPISRDFFLETKRIKHSRTKPIFFTPVQLGNTKIDENINDLYSSMNLHGNILLSEMVLKKLMRKETSSNIDNKHTSKGAVGSAHDLAYRYYLGR